MAKRVPSAGSYVGFAFHGAGAIRRSWARPGAAFTFYLSLISAPIPLRPRSGPAEKARSPRSGA